MSNPTVRVSAPLPVDAHVHLHRLADVAAGLDAAARHFARVAPDRAGLAGAILLTQTSRERVFEGLASSSRCGAWRFDPCPGEPESLLARTETCRLLVVCGRQVRARGGLEVAALGTLRIFEDGQPFESTLDQVVASDAVAAVPWGFGKWIGARGRAVESALRRPGNRGVLVGDSGSRLGLANPPVLVRRLQRAGLRVVAGTDPFPFARDFQRIGSFGFLAGVDPDPANAPWRAIRDWLRSAVVSPPTYGRPSGPVRFVLNQLGMQVYNRLPRSAVP